MNNNTSPAPASQLPANAEIRCYLQISLKDLAALNRAARASVLADRGKTPGTACVSIHFTLCEGHAVNGREQVASYTLAINAETRCGSRGSPEAWAETFAAAAAL